MAEAPRHFVFDFARVLFRWRPQVVIKTVLPARAVDDASAEHWVAQIFQAYQGDWADYDRGTVQVPELVRRIAARTGLRADEVQAVVDAVAPEMQPIAESVALMQRLRRPGVPMFFLSNMPAPVADHLERENEFVRQFDQGVFSARVQRVKPEPAIFELCTQRFGVPASSLIFLDDHEPNVHAARAAGWQAILFEDAAQCERDIRQAGWWPA